jgi:hypothetical protein
VALGTTCRHTLAWGEEIFSWPGYGAELRALFVLKLFVEVFYGRLRVSGIHQGLFLNWSGILYPRLKFSQY